METVGDELSKVAGSAKETEDALEDAVPGEALVETEALSEQSQRLHRELDEIGDEATESAGEVSALSASLAGLQGSMAGLDAPDIQPDISDPGIDLPDLDPEAVRAPLDLESDEARPLAETLGKATEAVDVATPRRLSSALRIMGESTELSSDRLVDLSDRVEDVTSSMALSAPVREEMIDDLRRLGQEAELSEHSLAILTGSTERLADSEDVRSLRDLSDEVTELGDLSGLARAETERLDDVVRSYARTSVEASIGAEKLQEALADVDREASGASRAIGDLSGTETALIGPTIAVLRALSNLSREMDEVEDETDETTRSMTALGAAMTALSGTSVGLSGALDAVSGSVDSVRGSLTSLNVGPVNLSLRNLSPTLVTVLGVLGPIVAGMLGFATAILAVGGALGAVLGIGLLGFLEQIENRFAGVEDKAQALKKLMTALKDLVIEALAPLRSVRIDGLGPVGLFVEFLQFGISRLRDLAEILTELAEMPVVAESIERIVTALTTADEGPRLITALKEAVRDLLPMITDLIVFLINNLPELIVFLTDIAEHMKGTGDNLKAIIAVSARAIEFFSGFLKVILEVAGAISTLMTVVFDAISAITGLDESTLGAVSAFVVLGVVLAGWIRTVASAIGAVTSLSGVMYALGVAVGLAEAALAPLASALGVSVGTAGALVVAVVAVVGALAWMVTHMEQTVSIIQDIEDAFRGMFGWLGAIAVQAGALAGPLMAVLVPGLILIRETFKLILDSGGSVDGLLSALSDRFEAVGSAVDRVLSPITTLTDTFAVGIDRAGGFRTSLLGIVPGLGLVLGALDRLDGLDLSLPDVSLGLDDVVDTARALVSVLAGGLISVLTLIGEMFQELIEADPFARLARLVRDRVAWLVSVVSRLKDMVSIDVGDIPDRIADMTTDQIESRSRPTPRESAPTGSDGSDGESRDAPLIGSVHFEGDGSSTRDAWKLGDLIDQHLRRERFRQSGF